MLPKHALYCIARAILDNPDAGIIYSDECKIDAYGQRGGPRLKPIWIPSSFASETWSAT